MATKYGTGASETINGTSSADTLNGRGGNDTLNGLALADRLYGEGGNDTLRGGPGDDRLDGGIGIDTANYSDAAGGVTASLVTNASSGDRGADTLVAVENLAGGNYVDTLTGNDSANVLNGGLGDDVLDGGRGNDRLEGGGNDTTTNSGNDQLYGGHGDDSVFGYAGNDYVDGGDGNDTLRGGSGNDTVLGAAGADNINGWTGDDTISGGTGDDLVLGGTGNDYVDGWEGADTLYGEAGDDVLVAWTGNDRLYGGEGNDYLDGAADNDLLDGGAGADVLIGRDGRDYFVLRVSQGNDTVADFEDGVDYLKLDGLKFSNLKVEGSATGGSIVRTAATGEVVATIDSVAPAQLTAEDFCSGPQVLNQAPSYAWYHGCAPTAGASVMGYWDLKGYSNLFDAEGWANIIKTANVQDQISSPEHNAKYDPFPDNPNLAEPPDTSIADFMHTNEGSWTGGATDFRNVHSGMENYAEFRGYQFTAQNIGVNQPISVLWDALVAEIDAGRPMLFGVDHEGKGGLTHEVAVVGYDNRGTDGLWYGFHDSWTENEEVRWQEFRTVSPGEDWGVWIMTKVEPGGADVPLMAGQNSETEGLAASDFVL